MLFETHQLTVFLLFSNLDIWIHIALTLTFSAMDAQHPRTFSGSWTPYRALCGTFTGLTQSSPTISTRDWRPWRPTWSSPAYTGGLTTLVMSLQINIYRTFAAFESQLNKGILLDATTYVLPSEICSMVNVVLDAKNQSVKLCAADGVDRVRFSSSYPIMERNIIITSYVSAQIPLKDWRQHWENLNQHEAPSLREADNCAGEDSGKAFLIWWRKCHRNAAGICGNKVPD